MSDPQFPSEEAVQAGWMAAEGTTNHDEVRNILAAAAPFFSPASEHEGDRVSAWERIVYNEGDDDERIAFVQRDAGTWDALEAMSPPRGTEEYECWEIDDAPVTPSDLRELADLIEAEEAAPPAFSVGTEGESTGDER